MNSVVVIVLAFLLSLLYFDNFQNAMLFTAGFAFVTAVITVLILRSKRGKAEYSIRKIKQRRIQDSVDTWNKERNQPLIPEYKDF
jgi:hypothetical protein